MCELGRITYVPILDGSASPMQKTGHLSNDLSLYGIVHLINYLHELRL